MWIIKSTQFKKSSTVKHKTTKRTLIPVLGQPTTLSQFVVHEHFPLQKTPKKPFGQSSEQFSPYLPAAQAEKEYYLTFPSLDIVGY